MPDGNDAVTVTRPAATPGALATATRTVPPSAACRSIFQSFTPSVIDDATVLPDSTPTSMFPTVGVMARVSDVAAAVLVTAVFWTNAMAI
jgi:hypothetical protein